MRLGNFGSADVSKPLKQSVNVDGVVWIACRCSSLYSFVFSNTFLVNPAPAWLWFIIIFHKKLDSIFYTKQMPEACLHVASEVNP